MSVSPIKERLIVAWRVTAACGGPQEECLVKGLVDCAPSGLQYSVYPSGLERAALFMTGTQSPVGWMPSLSQKAAQLSNLKLRSLNTFAQARATSVS